MLRYIKIASVVAAMTFLGIVPAFADTPGATDPNGGTTPALSQSDPAMSTSGTDLTEFQDNPNPDSAVTYYTMSDGTVVEGVHNADGSWSAPTN